MKDYKFLVEAITLENAVTGLSRVIEKTINGTEVDIRDVEAVQGLSCAVSELAKNHSKNIEKYLEEGD